MDIKEINKNARDVTGSKFNMGGYLNEVNGKGVAIIKPNINNSMISYE